jgi:hypothetical protein
LKETVNTEADAQSAITEAVSTTAVADLRWDLQNIATEALSKIFTLSATLLVNQSIHIIL